MSIVRMNEVTETSKLAMLSLDVHVSKVVIESF